MKRRSTLFFRKSGSPRHEEPPLLQLPVLVYQVRDLHEHVLNRPDRLDLFWNEDQRVQDLFCCCCSFAVDHQPAFLNQPAGVVFDLV